MVINSWVEQIVAPGQALCNTDLGVPVTYVVTETDAGTTIVNHAVVTVRTARTNHAEFQGIAESWSKVPGSPSPNSPRRSFPSCSNQ